MAIALTTTAIGTLLPILGDAGVLPTKLGTNILASGSIGEIGPIIAISIALTSDNPGRTTAILILFAVIALSVGWLATRPARPQVIGLIARTLHSSAQLGVRICVMFCLLLVWLAAEFGLDVLLGAFAAGMVARLFLIGHSAGQGDPDAEESSNRQVQHRIEALGFGFFIPLFFVVSGVRFDLDALLDPVELVKVPMFLVLFLVVRGLPALLYRRDLVPRDVVALGLLQAAGLPLIVVITGIGVETGQMRTDNAAGLVGAGLLSVVILPIVALAIRRNLTEPETAEPERRRARGRRARTATGSRSDRASETPSRSTPVSRCRGTPGVSAGTDRGAMQQPIVPFVTAGRTVEHRTVVPHDEHVGLPLVAVPELLAGLPAVPLAEQFARLVVVHSRRWR